ncbi:sensor histidine kinase [Kamptonema formosum]|uniref:sensor histidine kinase n=1 Tax=Kamptonema formosum TaxID=331992 RepID=UPI000371E53C|nr:response regulator [Oscillatoria sp. PCC 10802]
MNHLSVLCSNKTDCILVVDDSPDNVLLIQTILEEEGYEIITAENGSTALALIEKSPPDLVLLDVMMPGMDGYEVTRRIRANTKLPFIPILLITAYDQSSLVQGLDMGADDFIRKPVELDELLARVRSLLRLKHSIDERDQMARLREDFVSRLTHDLRTPLVAADKMIGLLQGGALGEISPACSEALTTMARSNQNLLKMVNTLLEVYRYEAGRKSLNFFPVDLRELICEVAEELAPLASAKGLSLKLDLAQSAGSNDGKVCTAVGDRLELHRLITNLVGNAIQFTDAGVVEIRLKAAPPPPNAHLTDRSIPWVAIEVEDTGPGIGAADRQRIFERFLQGNHKRSGSGLGLHLSRQIVEAHQGTIEVMSELGKGSVFAVHLPTRQVP